MQHTIVIPYEEVKEAVKEWIKQTTRCRIAGEIWTGVPKDGITVTWEENEDGSPKTEKR